MNLRKYILGFFAALLVLIAPARGQDYLEVVCAGDTGLTYFVQGTEGSTFEWTVNGGTITRNFGDSIVVDWGDAPGEYELRVQETSVHGCAAEPKTAMILISSVSVNLGDDTYVCQGEVFEIQLENTYTSYLWNDGSTGSSYSSSQEGLITIEVTNEYGCVARDELYLEVNPLPVVDLGPDTSLCGMDYLALDAGGDGVSYQWSTGESSQQITLYEGKIDLWVVVEDEFGCVNSDTIVIEDCSIEQMFKDIPNTISPFTVDGMNDSWNIEPINQFPDAVVEIYDRWGRMIWRSSPGYSEPWRGLDMNGREVPMDSYHFVILLNDQAGNRVNGTVTVLR